MRRPVLPALTAVVLVVLLARLAPACSSTGLVRPDPAPDAGTGNGKTCFESMAPNQGCIYCVESLCAPQLFAFENDCTDLIDCECPGGYFNRNSAPSCTSKAAEASCTGPVQAFGQCQTQSCYAQCTALSGGGDGG